MNEAITESCGLQWTDLAAPTNSDDIPNCIPTMDMDAEWSGKESPWPQEQVEEETTDHSTTDGSGHHEVVREIGEAAGLTGSALGHENSMQDIDSFNINYTTSAYQPDEQHAEAEDDAFSEELASKYELRQQPRFSRNGFTSTWIDHDDTGDYDPAEEKRKPKARRNRVKVRELADDFADIDSAEEGAVSTETEVREKPKLIVQLKVPSDAGRAALQTCLRKLPAHSELRRGDCSTGYHLRRKTSASDSTDDKPTSTQNLPEDLTGHPVARGCWECANIGIRCPLLDDERAWPCYTCQADDHDCDLITPPAQKRACERCKVRRRTCSYTFTLDHSEPCQDCADDGFSCVAGPARESVRPRIRYDKDWKKDPLPVKKAGKSKTYWTCLQCKESGRECSFTAGISGEVCTACEMAGSICFPEQTTIPCRLSSPPPRPALPQKRRAPKEPTQQQPPTKKAKLAQPSETKPTPSEINKRISSGNTKGGLPKQHRHTSLGETTKIFTKFSHPIIFNSEKGCNFCDGSSVSILGLEQKQVEVIDWDDGRGLTEVSGGHMGDGVPNTKMCMPCTMQRVTAMMCTKHEMRPIRGTETQILDADGALMSLFSGALRKKDRWCSVCPALAIYECETPGLMDATGRPCDGCGLLLCETCMLSLTGVYDGDLQKMLEGMRDEPSADRPLGLRADFELLKQEGLLMRYVLWSSQQ